VRSKREGAQERHKERRREREKVRERERERERGGRRGNFSLWPRSRRTRMLECSNVRETANPHLPFPRARAYAETTRGRGTTGGKGSRGREWGKMASAYVRARRWVCPGAVCRAHSCDLQLMKLRVQSRRMSNKYVSRRPRRGPHARRRAPSPPRSLPPPPPSPPPLPSRTTYPLHSLPSQPLPPLPLRRPSSRGSSSRCPDAVNQLLPFSPLALTL